MDRADSTQLRSPVQTVGDVVSETVRVVILSQVRVRVHDVQRAAAFFGSVFSCELRHAQRNTSRDLAPRVARDRPASCGTAGVPGQPSPAARGVLGVIFVFARDPRRAVGFYQRFAGWTFEAIGREREILFVKEGPAVGIRAAGKAPDGHSGTVTFHISVPNPEPVIEAISEHAGRVGPPAGAGIFTTCACSDDQGTPFSLWYQPGRRVALPLSVTYAYTY